MVERVPMTARGAEQLRLRLKELKEFERPKNIQDIEDARAHGDLKENAEYHAAKDRQGMIMATIRDIEDKLARAQVIDPAGLSGDRVVFGATVTVLDLDKDEETTYYIVGEDEADLKNGMISVTAPFARALIGKSVGDEVVVKTPGGKRELEILAVRFE